MTCFLTWSISTIYKLVFLFLIFGSFSYFSWCLLEKDIPLTGFIFEVYVEGMKWHAYSKPKYIKIISCLHQLSRYTSLPDLIILYEMRNFLLFLLIISYWKTQLFKIVAELILLILFSTAE